MVDASRASRDVASELLGSSLVFDASVHLQTDGAIYKAVAENKMVSSVQCHPCVVHDSVLLTGQGRNRLALWCGP